MTWLAEDALMIWVVGAIALTLALVVYWQTGTRRSQLGIAGAVLVTAALLVAEAIIETPREAVRRTLDEIVAAVRENDMAAVLAAISPQAVQLRSDVADAMPRVDIDAATIVGPPKIDLDLTQSPPQATVTGRGFIQATLKRNGIRGHYMAQVTVTFVQEGDRWLVSDYQADQDWRRAARR